MNETIEIRKRDMVNSCPLGDELKRLRDNNGELLLMLEEEKAKVKKLEDDLEGYRVSLSGARQSRDDAEEERDHWYDQCTIAKCKAQLPKDSLE